MRLADQTDCLQTSTRPRTPSSSRPTARLTPPTWLRRLRSLARPAARDRLRALPPGRRLLLLRRPPPSRAPATRLPASSPSLPPVPSPTSWPKRCPVSMTVVVCCCENAVSTHNVVVSLSRCGLFVFERCQGSSRWRGGWPGIWLLVYLHTSGRSVGVEQTRCIMLPGV